MPYYRRARVPGGTYFFTVNLLERDRRWLIDHIGHLRIAFGEAHAARPFDIVAAVMLPDHLHCIWRLPPGDADNATRWRHIKSAFSRSLPVNERRSPRRRAKAERGIWQRRYWEHLIRDERDLAAHVDYVISTLSSTDLRSEWWIGRIRRSIGTFRGEGCRRIGRQVWIADEFDGAAGS